MFHVLLRHYVPLYTINFLAMNASFADAWYHSVGLSEQEEPNVCVVAVA